LPLTLEPLPAFQGIATGTPPPNGVEKLRLPMPITPGLPTPIPSIYTDVLIVLDFGTSNTCPSPNPPKLLMLTPSGASSSPSPPSPSPLLIDPEEPCRLKSKSGIGTLSPNELTTSLLFACEPEDSPNVAAVRRNILLRLVITLPNVGACTGTGVTGVEGLEIGVRIHKPHPVPGLSSHVDDEGGSILVDGEDGNKDDESCSAFFTITTSCSISSNFFLNDPIALETIGSVPSINARI